MADGTGLMPTCRVIRVLGYLGRPVGAHGWRIVAGLNGPVKPSFMCCSVAWRIKRGRPGQDDESTFVKA
jgi:hypothetical protein